MTRQSKTPLLIKTFICLIFIGMGLLGNLAMAEDSHILNQAYFEDKSNALDLEAVKKKTFTSYDGMLSEGYKPSTFWIRLKIPALDQEMALRVRPAYTEAVELFDPDTENSKRITGAKYPWRASDIPSYGHNFKLQADKQGREIYLKVKSSRSYLVALDLIPIGEYMNIDHTDQLLNTGYIIFTLALAIGLFGTWLSNREWVLGVFTLQQFIAFFHTFLIVGYARIFLDRYFDDQTINAASHGLIVTYPLIAIFANKLLLEDYGLKRSFQYVFNALLLISAGVITLMVFGYTGVSLNINAELVMATLVTCIPAAFFGIKKKNPEQDPALPIYALRAYYVFNLIMWSIAVLPLLGIVQGGEITLHSLLLYNMISGLLFFWLLQYRARSMLKNEIVKANAMKKQAENERFRREEQSKLMSMLTHEIRTPLSVLKLVVDRKVAGSDLEDFANRAVSNIDSIIDRCLQLDQLDFRVLKINKTDFNFRDLINSVLDDFEDRSRVDVHGNSDIWLVSDGDICRIIISNLIGNAFKYSEPLSNIYINFKETSQGKIRGIQFEVINTVGGMGSPDPEHVFEKYYRNSSATKISGSGLGLFLVKELVGALHGDVTYSINNELIKFTVWIPA